MLLGLALGSVLGLQTKNLVHPYPLFQDGCVLQRDTDITIWGNSGPDDHLKISISGKSGTQSQQVPADSRGNWRTTLDPHKAGGPYTIVVVGKSGSAIVKDVQFGEVWICSGQSNMEFGLGEASEGPAAIKEAHDPLLRMFTIPETVSDVPLSAPAGGSWVPAEGDKIAHFSAVGYFFAKRLRAELGVPVGMIHSSWGGTRIEAWTSIAKNRELGLPEDQVMPFRLRLASDPKLAAKFDAWKKAGSPMPPFLDPGRNKLSQGWENGDESGAWSPVQLPGEYGTLGVPSFTSVDGAIWFRRSITLSEEEADGSATLSLGAIDDYDDSFVNGTKIGHIGAESPSPWSTPRNYQLDRGILHAGPNLIAVRVWDMQGGGGFIGPAEQMVLTTATGKKIDLKGPWEARAENIRPEPVIQDPNSASVLFNGMVAPLTGYRVKGVIWYQGENNAWDAVHYRANLLGMIADWRTQLNEPNLTFLVSQLAPFRAEGSDKTSYALLREAQSEAARADNRVGTAVITDVGNETDIHPKDKKPVGERLARLAESIAYGRKIYAIGPRFSHLQILADRLRVTFDHVGLGLMVKGGKNSGIPVSSSKLVGFQVAGADGKFVTAKAILIDKETVEVWSESVPSPRFVRFGFTNFPIVNLWSKSGLPAEPFRSNLDFSNLILSAKI